MTSEVVLDIDETLDEDLDDQEPIMEGSDDDFSDLGEEGESDDDVDVGMSILNLTINSPLPPLHQAQPASLLHRAQLIPYLVDLQSP